MFNNVKVKDIVVQPGMEMFNSDFRCWEPITKVVKIPHNKYGSYEVHSAVDCSVRGPDEELSLRIAD